MSTQSEFATFLRARRGYYERLDAIRAQIEPILEKAEAQTLTLAEIAMLVGLHAERGHLIEEYQALEDKLIEHLLTQRNAAARDGSGPLSS